MKKNILLPLLFICQFIFAQKQVTNLHYVGTEHIQTVKKNVTKEKYHYNFNWNPETQLVVMNRTSNGRPFTSYIFDQKRRVTIMQRMDGKKDYAIEETDSLFYHLIELKKTDETKTIMGYKCHNYTASYIFQLAMAVTAPINYEYSIWVTDELEFNDATNMYQFALMRSMSDVGDWFKGVVVEFDTKLIRSGSVVADYTLILDTSKLDQKPEVINWPWQNKDYSAFLFVSANHCSTNWVNEGNNYQSHRLGDGSGKSQYERVKALVVEITGQEKPKIKNQIFFDEFY